MDINPRDFSRLPDGTFVENDVLRIVDTIEERYGNKVKVRYLPPEAGPGITDPPYIICELVPATGKYERIFDAWFLDHRVLHRLEELDTLGKNAAELLKKMEADAQKPIEEANKRHADWRENEAKPMIAAAFKKSQTFTFKNDDGEIVKLHG